MPAGAGITAGRSPPGPLTDVTRIAGGVVWTVTGSTVPVDASAITYERP